MTKWQIGGAILLILCFILLFEPDTWRGTRPGSLGLLAFLGLMALGGGFDSEQRPSTPTKFKSDTREAGPSSNSSSRNYPIGVAGGEFEPAYKTPIHKDISIQFGNASHVADGEHLTSCPKCGRQKVLRTGTNSYPKGVRVACRVCEHIFHIY
jgi:hypothetical protein